MRKSVVYGIREGVAKKKHLFAKIFLPTFVFALGAVGIVTVSTVLGGGPPPPTPSVKYYDQCSNDDGDGYATGDTGCRWTNGNLQSNNSTYYEGDATVQRLLLEDITPGTHTVTFQYDTTKNGKHAYDFLTDDNFSELTPNTITNADFCDGAGSSQLPSCSSISPTSSSIIPTDTNAAGFDVAQSARHFKIRNGAITGVSTLSMNGSYAGDSETTVTVIFTVSSSCADKYQKQTYDVCAVLMTFGAHVSRQADWGAGNSAVNISGSPYHVALFKIDNTSIGDRDNQMQANAVVVPPTLTLVKHVINDYGATANASAWTLTATGTGGFSGTGSPATGTDASISAYVTAGIQYNLSESGGPAGYSSTDVWVCTGNGTFVSPDKITITNGQTATCTITNNDLDPTLTLVKAVTNDNGGNAQPTDWTLSASGPTPISGTSGSQAVSSVAVDLGTYTLSESSGPNGYTGGTYSCVNNGGQPVVSNTISLVPGDNAVCTITNNDQQAYIIVDKTVINDNGGSAVADDFQLTVDGNAVLDEAAYPVNPGSHTAGETPLSGYSAGAWSGDCNTDANVTVALGETKTCTITNDDQPGTLTVNKVVINDNGGTATADDFVFQVNGGEQTPFNDGQKIVTVDAGTYTVTEPTVAGYDTTYNNCTELVIPNGGSATCTITNDDVAPTLTLVKNVINDNGGTATETDWTLAADGPTSISGTSGSTDVTDAVVDAGTYTLSESGGPSGYTAGIYSCSTNEGDPEESNSLLLELGDFATCIITNDDQPGTLIIKKVVINDNAGSSVASDFTFQINGGEPGSFDEDGQREIEIDAGTYTVTEPTVAGYDTTYNNCTELVIPNGGSATCTITNNDSAPPVVLGENTGGTGSDPQVLAATLTNTGQAANAVSLMAAGLLTSMLLALGFSTVVARKNQIDD